MTSTKAGRGNRLMAILNTGPSSERQTGKAHSGKLQLEPENQEKTKKIKKKGFTCYKTSFIYILISKNRFLI